MTLDDFEQLSDINGVQELLDGHLVEIPPPKLRQSVLIRQIQKLLERYVDESRVWIEAGFLIIENCAQPDVAVIHPSQPVARDWYSGGPLIAIEVASRGNTPSELQFKKELYLSHGSHEVWIVFDKTRTIEWYGPGGLNYTYRDKFHSEALNADISVGDIFD